MLRNPPTDTKRWTSHRTRRTTTQLCTRSWLPLRWPANVLKKTSSCSVTVSVCLNKKKERPSERLMRRGSVLTTLFTNVAATLKLIKNVKCVNRPVLLNKLTRRKVIWWKNKICISKLSKTRCNPLPKQRQKPWKLKWQSNKVELCGKKIVVQKKLRPRTSKWW